MLQLASPQFCFLDAEFFAILWYPYSYINISSRSASREPSHSNRPSRSYDRNLAHAHNRLASRRNCHVRRAIVQQSSKPIDSVQQQSIVLNLSQARVIVTPDRFSVQVTVADTALALVAAPSSVWRRPKEGSRTQLVLRAKNRAALKLSNSSVSRVEWLFLFIAATVRPVVHRVVVEFSCQPVRRYRPQTWRSEWRFCSFYI